ncbi:hypothetical protein [Actinotalea fermentans]|uniref:Uncharacterized protein n=1 Tax=Actinotalea fermentans TaxID=43671 RepID=A0A511Z0T4_9CELL|nr:hypothetical protein [Actinotalea fermentans]KGM16748.1 hypothetical protein N867_16270 [Actinotalea fermentans ATCC 43279 = JCM 9966 = DSM 3133]GEN81032.1 hypothetical protein AFE02nite_27660 [Actinotalea fermentans]
MARTSKDKAARAAATEAPVGTTTSASTWSPVPDAATVPRTTVGARSGGLGIGSPIYEELVAELGDPAA